MSSISLRATKRLRNEYKKFRESPPDNIQVAFKDLILEWHFLFSGLNDTPFKGGEYHGVLIFPEDYPFSPPSIRFITPNGRFKINTIVCFELSVFHPECWKPAYTVSAVLQGVYSFMMSETTDTVGSLVRDEKIIRELAEKSQEFNIKDGSTETFQDEIKVEPTEVSDADINPPIFKKMNDDVSESTVSSKVAKITENAGTAGSLVLDKNFTVESTTTNRESPPEKLNDQSENVNLPPNKNEKPILRITLKPSHVIQTPEFTKNAGQLISPDYDKVNNSSIPLNPIPDTSQQLRSSTDFNIIESQEDNVNSTSKSPGNSEIVQQHFASPNITQTASPSTTGTPNKLTGFTANVKHRNNISTPKTNEVSSGKSSKQGNKDGFKQTKRKGEKIQKSQPLSSQNMIHIHIHENGVLSEKDNLEERWKKITTAKH